MSIPLLALAVRAYAVRVLLSLVAVVIGVAPVAAQTSPTLVGKFEIKAVSTIVPSGAGASNGTLNLHISGTLTPAGVVVQQATVSGNVSYLPPPTGNGCTFAVDATFPDSLSIVITPSLPSSSTAKLDYYFEARAREQCPNKPPADICCWI